MISKNLRDLRTDSDLSQADVAKILNVAHNTYSRYELGVTPLTDETIIKLADFFGTSADYILDRTRIKTPNPKE